MKDGAAQLAKTLAAGAKTATTELPVFAEQGCCKDGSLSDLLLHGQHAPVRKQILGGGGK